MAKNVFRHVSNNPGLRLIVLVAGLSLAIHGLTGSIVCMAADISVAADEVLISVNGLCSLREAIVNANAGSATHVDCASGSSGADTIVLAPGATYSITDIDNLQFGPNGLPPVASEITIEGHGAVILRDGAIVFRLLRIRPEGVLEISHVTLSNGHAKGGNGDGVYDNEGGEDGAGAGGAGLGGGIFNEGALELRHVTIVGCTAEGGQGGDTVEAGSGQQAGGMGGNRGWTANGAECIWSSPEGTPGCGGDLGADGGFGGGGGGLMPGCDPFNDPGCPWPGYPGSVGDGGFGGGGGGSNGLAGFGGGNGSTLANHQGFGGGGLGAGGAIFNRGGTVSLTNCTLSGNDTLPGTTAAPAQDGHAFGGAVFNLNGDLTIASTTFKDNTAEEGGALYNLGLGGTAVLDLVNTILADSIGGADCVDGGTTSIVGADNLIEYNSGCPGSVLSDDPLLGPLSANGGPTPTHPLGSGSPALDRIANADCDASSALAGIDQRGGPRSFDGDASPSAAECDIGSYERRERLQRCAPFSGAQDFSFTSGSVVSISIETLGDIECIEVEEMSGDHPYASFETLTGNWFHIAAFTLGDGPATGFALEMTLSQPDFEKPSLCRWPGAAGWDCDATSFTIDSVTRSDVSILGDWAVGSLTKPEFTKTFFPDTVFSDQISTLSFLIDQRAGSAPANDLSFTDSLPSGMVVANPSNAVDGCGGMLTAPSGAGDIMYTAGLVAAGATCTVSVDVSTSVPGFAVNTSDVLTSNQGVVAPATATLEVLPVPTFLKAFSPSAINLGGGSTLTFTIDNTQASVPVEALAFTDILPAGVEIAVTPNGLSNCGGTLGADAGASTISFIGGSVDFASSCTVSVDVTSSVGGDHLNISEPLTSNAGISGAASAILSVATPPLFSKAFGPAAIVAGDFSTLVFTIDNSANSIALGGLGFNDSMPSGLSVAPVPNAGTTCSGGTLTAPAGGTLISFSGGTVNSGAACKVSVDVTAADGGQYDNTSEPLISEAGSGNVATATLAVTEAPSFAKHFDPETIVEGSTARLIFTIDSTVNPLHVGGLSFTDALPTGIEIAPTPNAITSCSGGDLGWIVDTGTGATTITYDGGSIDAGATCTVSIDVTSDVAGDHLNTSSPLVSQPGVGTNASATLTVLINEADLTIEKTVDDPTPAVGAEVLFTITVSNNGPRDATGILVEDQLPAGLVLVAAIPSQGSYSESAGHWDVGVIDNGNNATLELTCGVLPPPALPETTATNVATILALDQNDPDDTNDAASVEIDVRPLDFGDAPDPFDASPGHYPSVLASDGARHGGDGSLRLGALWDFEYDGQPSANADGDDNMDASDDEDGVTWTTAIVHGNTATVQVEIIGSGKLSAWIDWNMNGSWLDPGEHVIVDAVVETGVQSHEVPVPDDATPGVTFARFRLDSAGGLTPTGPTTDGEVEDYQIVVEDSTLNLTATSNPSTLPEPGGPVVFSLVIDNNGSTDAELSALIDDVFGDLADTGNPQLISTTCSVPQTILIGGAYSCDFTAVVSGNAGEVKSNIVLATGSAAGFPVSGSGETTVSLGHVAPSVHMLKTASPSTIPEPGAVVTFGLTLENTGVTSDPVTVTSLVDDVFGDVTQVQGNIQSTTCALPQVVNPGNTFSCFFTAWIDGNAGESAGDVVTATGMDDDGSPFSASASVAVSITDILPQIIVTKTVDPPTLLEPGGDVTFTVQVENQTAEQITLTSLVDDIHGILDGQGTCTTPQTIAGNGVFACAFTKALVGQGGDSETDTVTAIVEDDEGHQAQDQDSATVTFSVAQPPVVNAVAIGDDPVTDCGTITSAALNIGVTLWAESPPLSHADQITSYLLVQSGPDGDFATTSVNAGADGDDLMIVPIGLSYLETLSGAQVNLELADELGAGLYRLLVSDTIIDAAANNLDGDGDDIPGGDFMIDRFRMDTGNLLANGNFDDCPVTLWPWTPELEAGSGNTIQVAFDHDRDYSPLSGAANISTIDEGTSSISQCVNSLIGNQNYRLEIRLELDATGTAPSGSLSQGCLFFDLPDCAGAEIGESFVSSPLSWTERPWASKTTEIKPPPGVFSARCGYTVQAQSADPFEFESYLDGLFLGDNSMIYTDGFESGDTSQWAGGR